MLPKRREVESGVDETVSPPAELLTARGLRELERSNMVRALEQAEWRVSGAKGAARLLGMNPSTLKSRMKALDLRRPRPD